VAGTRGVHPEAPDPQAPPPGVPDPEVAALADPVGLGAWLEERFGTSAACDLRIVRRSRGSSNEMFEVSGGVGRWILRRPTKVALARAGAGIAREFRLLGALEGTPVPHPRPVALCEDPSVIGAPFYLMEVVDGVEPVDPLPEALVADPTARHALGIALVDALAELASFDWRGRGLADFGRPEGFHERQVPRWHAQLESYAERALAGVDDVERWLSANRPDSFEPGVMHGDYHQGNLLIGRDLPVRVLAIVDWENATIGDPLLDLGYFLSSWPDPGETTRLAGRIKDRTAMATRAELVARYEARTGRRVGDIDYYVVLSLYRLAVMLEGVAARGRALGRDTGGTAAYVDILLDEACRLVAGH